MDRVDEVREKRDEAAGCLHMFLVRDEPAECLHLSSLFFHSPLGTSCENLIT